MSDTTHAPDRFARTTVAVVAAAFALVGVLGFVPGITTSYDSLQLAEHHSEAKLLGIFQVSVLHNVVHLLFGAVGFAAVARPRLVLPYLFGGAAIYLVLTLYGAFIDHESAANFVPLNTADNWLHLGLAAGMAALGAVVLSRRRGTTRRSA